MTDSHDACADPETAQIIAYLNSVDLQLLAAYDWKLIRQGLAAATGLRVTDRVWEYAVLSCLSTFGAD